MSNPVEFNYQPGLNGSIYYVLSSLTAGATPKFYNTSTLFYETYNSSNETLYAINIPEVSPGYYRALRPAASLLVPATEIFYRKQGSVANLSTDAPAIGNGNSQGVDIQTLNGIVNNGIGSNVGADVDICNQALQHLGQRKITTLSDATENARKCNLIYNSVRDAVLRDCSWNFATIIEALVQLPNETITGWQYVYSVPTACLYIRKVFCDDTYRFDWPIFPVTPNFVTPTTNPDPQSYKLVYDSNISSMVIVANINPAYIEYTARMADPSKYDSLFIEALTYKLASRLSAALNGDPAQGERMAQFYLNTISEAMRTNGNESGVPRTQKSAYMDVR